MKKWIIGVAVFAILLGGWRIGGRWWVLRKLYRHPDAKHRIAVVPKEIDLSDVQVAHGVICDVGYAEFVIPSSAPVDLRSTGNGCAVLGETEDIWFALLAPFDPSAPDRTADGFKAELSKLPKSHPLRKQFASPGATGLDLEIHAEHRLLPSLWEIVMWDDAHFAFNTVQLFQKGSSTGGGMHSVHKYKTPDTRGLVRVGENPTDLSYAHVSMENRSGTQAVGMLFRVTGNNTNNVMNLFATVLKSFRFKAENLDSKDEVKKIIAEAGILPRKEEHESPTRVSPQLVQENMNRTWPILMLALLCGCSGNPAPQLTLPSAPHSPGIIDLDPRMQEVTIEASGGLWFRDRQVSAEELRARMRSRLTELHDPPVAIRADADLSMRTVRKAIQLLDSLGVRRHAFLVLREPPDHESVINFVTFGPRHRRPVEIHIGPDDITFNFKAIDRSRLTHVLSGLATYRNDAPIVIVPDPAVSLQRCVDVLDACSHAGLRNLHLLGRSSLYDTPTQDAQPAEFTVPSKAAPGAPSTVR